ncbi:signal peptidase II [Tolypothrix sp. PCC 7601]|nr:signal peptidase II [Tolypothrix sp. PCC 7601]
MNYYVLVSHSLHFLLLDFSHYYYCYEVTPLTNLANAGYC